LDLGLWRQATASRRGEIETSNDALTRELIKIRQWSEQLVYSSSTASACIIDDGLLFLDDILLILIHLLSWTNVWSSLFSLSLIWRIWYLVHCKCTYSESMTRFSKLRTALWTLHMITINPHCECTLLFGSSKFIL
jgi:hypothetical protein